MGDIDNRGSSQTESHRKALKVLAAQPDWLSAHACVLEQMNTLTGRFQSLLVEGLAAEQARSQVGLEAFEIQARCYLDLIVDATTLSAYLVVLEALKEGELKKVARTVIHQAKPPGINEEFWKFTVENHPESLETVIDPLGAGIVEYESDLSHNVQSWTAKAFRKAAAMGSVDKNAIDGSATQPPSVKTPEKEVEKLVEEFHSFWLTGIPEKRAALNAELLELHRMNLTCAAFTERVFQAYSGFLENEVVEKVRAYGVLGRTDVTGRMLSPEYTAKLHDRIMEDVGTNVQDIEKYLHRVHSSYSANSKLRWFLPSPHKYTIVHKYIHQVLKAELEQLPSSVIGKRRKASRVKDVSRKGDLKLLGNKFAVVFRTAEEYLGITDRQRQILLKRGALVPHGKGSNRMVTTESLLAYLPPKDDTN